MVTNRIIFFATSVQPNPEEIDYWVDLSDNPYGGSIKYFNGTEWVRLAASGGTPDLSNYYTKTQVNKLLNDKANISDVDSKVDDEEVKDVIKDIQFNTSNPNGITMVMFKYDGSNDSISLPIASTGSAGIVTSKDFLDFVKQHQLQELHTEMIDTFADIRAKYQKKLIAGLNIEIDQETNVISASGDLAVQWDNITNKPDFKPVATSGDYNDLINKLKPGKDVSISEDNVISIAIDSDSLEQSLATLQSNIDKEAATARAAETKLGNDIATEKNRAESAEQTISTNLQNEIDRSTQIDTQHTNAINKEIQDRKEAIATEVSDRNAAILVETNRAKGAESANATAIANEVERATGVEETLNSNITQLQTQKVDKVEGKGLSTNDYTTPEKNKLAAIEAEANKYVLPAATTTTLGGIIVGDRLSIDSTGKLVATYTYTLPTASSTVLGGVKTGSNITNTNGTISLTKANVTSALGVDPTTTYVNKAGDTMTGLLKIKNSVGGAQLELHSTESDGGAYMRFYNNNQTVNTWYFGVGASNNLNIGYNTITKATFGDGQLTLNTSSNLAPIKTNSTTLCTNLNADLLDGKNVIENGTTSGLDFTKRYTNLADGQHQVWIKLATLQLPTDNLYGNKQIAFEIIGGNNIKHNTINYASLVASTRERVLVKLVMQQSVGVEFIAGYVTTSTNVEIWLGCLGEWNNTVTATCKFSSNASDILTSGSVTTKPDNFVLGEIITLDAPDWYGVSWLETSSNPDCTRIGNMDMHRSLPIQSMMKGYLYFKDGNPLYRMLKLNDSWTKCENYSAGGWRDVSTLLEDNNVNVMIKIPEFWWIDDYVESTETHNLKICPHAKPGWHHHKEAYVSAYEGYIDGNYYRSSKNKIPSVNFTRSTVRPKARANGLGNSWNIYTYNEHRAICHLFLVEYATRNSQKAVNTALTVEGFRQGGLGSGCTTGTVTINGAQTWSFIPTGSSDSLGSGSGEVTVTIQQTDSSGSNTTTTTRKCNRYRGIENPFGHVWKHTDDVISVYISGYGARFWYKCDSPDHFGDSISNDNPYYKNIAANAVVTGYKTKIVTTSTCDFFALSCNNGSETTYWCDYNWDNTDSSLHCLSIGGRSDDGGAAGLFYLNSNTGVGHSSASIGSRLTYLPWAE